MTFLLTLALSLHASTTQIIYSHPLPNSQYHSPATTIIIRLDDQEHLINRSKVMLIVLGEDSVRVEGKTILSSDGKTIIFKPAMNFTKGEKVSVAVKYANTQFESSFSFHISEYATSAQSSPPEAVRPGEPLWEGTNDVRLINGVSVPSDFPTLQINQKAATDSGYVFLTTYDLSKNYAMLMRNDGTPCFYYRSPSRLWDFTVQPDGTLSLMEGMTARTFDQHFELSNTYKCGHGYKTDYHEFRLTPQGHALLIVEDIQPFDMSQLVDGGKTNARIVGNHIQELDAEKNVIFEWRSWDHYNIVDAPHENFTTSTIHPIHINAIDIDYDGHLLICARSLDEITKINRNTGEIIWRLGGRNNQFTFLNDPDQFNYQHHIRAVPGKPGFYTLFDNGKYHTPAYSRAVEYTVDVAQKTVRKVWEYRHTPDYYSHWMGSVDRLPNGNTAICWALKSLPNYTEVDQNGEIVFNVDFQRGVTSYRAHRHVWQGRAKRPFLFIEPSTKNITLIYNQFGASDIQYYNIYADIEKDAETWIDSTTAPYIQLVEQLSNNHYYFRVTSVDSAGIESEFSNQVDAHVRLVHSGENQIRNGDFSQEFSNWVFHTSNDNIANWDIDDLGQLTVQVFSSKGNANDVQISQRQIILHENNFYRLEFDAYADINRPLDVRLMDDHGFRDFSEFGLVQLTKRNTRYRLEFEQIDGSTDTARLFFKVGDMVGDVFFDNISLIQIDETATENKRKQRPDRFKLYSSFPNPFNARSTIRYELPKSSRVQLTFYDILGRKVESKDWHRQQAGIHQYEFDAERLSSGIYFCQIIASDESARVQFMDTTKLILVK